jgi:2-polyprenyl-3-methyl-5-hydroxy-6-metoxy-1,4-benzoquinol methylase
VNDPFASRRRRAEIMDQPGLDRGAHSQALRGLRRINCLSASASILWPEIARLTRHAAGRTVRVLDVATGGGDVPIRLARRARRCGLDVPIDGCDISPTAVAFAATAADTAGVTVGFFPLDALTDPLPGGYDILACSLFLHHLSEEDAVRLLAAMAGAAQSAVLVNDLVRSRAGYCLAWAGCRVLSRCPVVHHDGPASVRSAFRFDEVRALAERAGLAGFRLERRWPGRFLLAWNRGRS